MIIFLVPPTLMWMTHQAQLSASHARQTTGISSTAPAQTSGASGGILSNFDDVAGAAIVATKDLPDDVRAYHIGFPQADPITSFFSIMSTMDGGNNNPFGKASDYLGIVWSDGQEIQVFGKTFLVGYAIGTASVREMSMSPGMSMSSGSVKPSLANLKWTRTFIAENSITELQPVPNLTKADLLSIMANPPIQDTKAVAVSNIKQLDLGTIMYTDDNNDNFPAVNSSSAFFEKISPYVKNSNLARSLNPAGGRILFNVKLSGINQTSIPDPANTILIYDELPWPDQTMLVGFVDGHDKSISESEFKSVFYKSTHLNLKPMKPVSHHKSKAK